MKLPPDYYHCFMGNGLDAVLIGYTGAMVEERAQGDLDRCYWYKADRYYPEERTVIVPGRRPREGQPLRAEGAAWCELAPLARTWYEVRHDGLRLDARAFEQRFVAGDGILYSHVDYGAAKCQIVTFLHARRPLLVIHYVFDRKVSLRAYAAAGVWIEEGYDANPFEQVHYGREGAEAEFTLGTTRGHISLGLEPQPVSGGTSECLWLEVEAREITQYFTVVDDHDLPLDKQAVSDALASGYNGLREEHLALWHGYTGRASIEIPDERFQRLYDYSLYQFKAAQNRLSGGLPVNNLRLTWSSHVFWDAYFMHRVLLEANRLEEALEGVRFFMRTIEHARRHAAEDFGAPGLKWDWEITHDGRRAYGTWLHQAEQVHNNASYANMIWGYYEFTRDRDYLAEFYPVLRGLADFFMANVVEQTERGYEVRALVDVGEHINRVKNEGLNLTGTMRVLRLAAMSAQALNTDHDFAAHCSRIATSLSQTLDLLYNGTYFMSAEGADSLNLSSLAPIYPMKIISPDDPRAVSTAKAHLAREETPAGNPTALSPWGLGILATVFAMQGDGETAWRLISRCAPALCEFGGMSEYVLGDGRWNMQYFSTGQAAVCTAIHHLMLQERVGEISFFPAVPTSWPRCTFKDLLVNGVEVSGSLDRASGRGHAEMRNITSEPLATMLHYDGCSEEVVLPIAGKTRIEWQTR